MTNAPTVLEAAVALLAEYDATGEYGTAKFTALMDALRAAVERERGKADPAAEDARRLKAEVRRLAIKGIAHKHCLSCEADWSASESEAHYSTCILAEAEHV